MQKWFDYFAQRSYERARAEFREDRQSATNVWSLDRTWEQLGVPAGATVTSVRLVSIRQRTSQYTFAGNTNTWQVELRDSAGATQATLLPTQIETGLDSLWSTDLSGTDQPVPSALQASNAPVRLAIAAQMSTGGTFAASAVTFRWDHVALQITYQAPTAPPPAPAPTTASTSYGYDKLYRLTSASGPAGTTTYSYDPLGNRLSKGSTSYTYDRADRITSAGSTSYTLNADGNTTARGSDSFAYDQANRLTSAATGSGSGTYAYDGDGKRVGKTVGGTTTSYVYDVGGGLPVLLDDGVRKYVWGAGGLAYSVDESSGAVQVYHTDGLGSVRAITDSTGSVVQTYQTDEFGVPTLAQGTSTQPFGYTGEQRDPENGLVYLRARMYDPQSGRFLQKDPLRKSGTGGQGWNRFAYADDNPLTFRDPSGLSAAQSQALRDYPCAPADQLCIAMYEALIVGATIDMAESGFKMPGSGIEPGTSTSPLPNVPRVSLYRAVSSAELADIESFGGFRSTPNSYEGKLFAISLEDARAFGTDLYPNEPFHVVQVSIPESFYDALYKFTADRRMTVAVDRTELNILNSIGQIKTIE